MPKIFIFDTLVVLFDQEQNLRNKYNDNKFINFVE